MNKIVNEEQEKIKFVSMIDQKPIKPSYLDLIPMKNFTKKEQEAQRNPMKEVQKQENNEKQQLGMS